MISTITVLNKLGRKDSTTGKDVWYKTIIPEVKYKLDKVMNVVGTDVSMGEQYIVLIPFSDKYKSYDEWKKSDNDKNSTYTMSQGDYIFFTEVTDEITSSDVASIKNKYEPKVCEVRSIEEVSIDSQQYGVKIQLKVSGV